MEGGGALSGQPRHDEGKGRWPRRGGNAAFTFPTPASAASRHDRYWLEEVMNEALVPARRRMLPTEIASSLRSSQRQGTRHSQAPQDKAAGEQGAGVVRLRRGPSDVANAAMRGLAQPRGTARECQARRKRVMDAGVVDLPRGPSDVGNAAPGCLAQPDKLAFAHQHQPSPPHAALNNKHQGIPRRAQQGLILLVQRHALPRLPPGPAGGQPQQNEQQQQQDQDQVQAQGGRVLSGWRRRGRPAGLGRAEAQNQTTGPQTARRQACRREGGFLFKGF